MNHLFLYLKRNTHYIILAILIIVMTLVLLIREKRELIIISKDYVYSVYHSDNYETIDIELLTNNSNDYHFDNSYIISAKLYNDGQELSIEIIDIITSNTSIIFKDEEFSQVVIKLQLPFVSNDFLAVIEDALLEINYENGETINLSVGEINYLFKEDNNLDVSLNNLSATHEMYKGTNTIGGINIELGNLSNHNINITNIDIISNSIGVNKLYITEQSECVYTSTVNECLGTEFNTFTAPISDVDINILLGRNNSVNIYLPLTYTEDYQYIYEFAMIIDYEINGYKKQIIIDDFPYMRTSIFSTMKEADLHVYRIPN